jgi:hypothetical protein
VFYPVGLSALALGGLYYFVNVFITGGIFHQPHGLWHFGSKILKWARFEVLGWHYRFSYRNLHLSLSGILILRKYCGKVGASGNISYDDTASDDFDFHVERLNRYSDYVPLPNFENRELNPVTALWSLLCFFKILRL